MNNHKILTALAFSFLFLFSNVVICIADDLVWNEGHIDDIFKKAKEQDRFVLLFAGNYKDRCRFCKEAFDKFNDPTGSLRKIVEDDYYTWFKSLFVYGTTQRNPEMSEIETFIAGYLEIRYDPTVSKIFPIICVINPDNPYEDFTEYWGPNALRTVEELMEAITPPDLFAGNKLCWIESEKEVFNLAKEQGKKIFKVVGKATSPNSKKMLKQLNEEPLLHMLNENYILWFSSDVSELALETGEDAPLSLPYISVIDPDDPENILASEWGYQDMETLEELINTYAVSNDFILQNNTVVVFGNHLLISNQIDNEQIYVYSLSGQRVACFMKNDYTTSFNATNFPKGILIVSSSAGWSVKALVK